MADYRVYLLDTDGSFYSVVPLVCADDGEAIEHAQRLAASVRFVLEACSDLATVPAKK